MMSDEPAGSTDRSLPVDALLDLLAHSRRRTLLTCLQTYDDPLPLPDLADEVAVAERDATLDAIPAETVKRVYMSLYHRHVPKLEDYDVVWYEQERDMVGLADRAVAVLPYLETVEAPADD